MIRVGHGFDVHRLAAGRPFILGGVTIPHETGPLGHSDALGDLGGHFPDTDPQWQGADSMRLLAAVHELTVRHGFTLANVDATVVVQHPKLAPYIDDMRERIAEVLAIDIGRVSVKAKTSEGLGYTGDGSGIAAYCVALVTRERAVSA
jgi:2-C-methyl-D-erythritol 2,4-cyclodiphosphate synthase